MHTHICNKTFISKRVILRFLLNLRRLKVMTYKASGLKNGNQSYKIKLSQIITFIYTFKRNPHMHKVGPGGSKLYIFGD